MPDQGEAANPAAPSPATPTPATPAERPWLRTLPNGKPISALGFGCSSLWAKSSFPDARAAEILDTLLAEGVNHFDTGPSYGEGLGETRLGRWLVGKPLDQLVITTKVGTNLVDGRIERGFTPDLIARSLDGSFARLGIDKVDVLYLHGPAVEDLGTPVFDFFERLKADGRITYAGVNSFDNPVLMKTAQSPIDIAMLQYNVADFRNRAAMIALHEAGKVVMSGTALARARFSPASFLPTSPGKLWYLLRMMRQEPLFPVTGLRLARRLRETGKEPAEAALQFLTGQPMILSSLFGTSSVEHAGENARAGHGQLSNRQWTRLADYA
ncbi:aldo/keto reductase [Novosphingobium sp. KCTC 2891]|uniref:aldo/keto reductase n=1 Tax=Novosphingobium sp. KCTC 2891 TaxID=2989730 RepID=UPI002221540A|nr:aldo/keto reductase [Novosphingobium sp. KCTC 2891]MCW1381419.1 aldo/keto reductase [Novosphingobium sp. KCTC 2891]